MGARLAPTLHAALGLCALSGCAATGEPVTAAAPPQRPLVGQESESLARTLGQPAARFREDDVEFWQYRRQGCVVELFLARDHGRLAVVRATAKRATRGTDQEAIPAEACLAGGSV